MGKQRFLGGRARGYAYFGGTTWIDGELLTVGNKIFEFRDAVGGLGAGNVWIDTSSGVAATVAAAFITAFNLNKPTPGVTAVIDPKSNIMVNLVADARGTAGNMTVSETVADAPTLVAGSLISGEAGGTQTESRGEYAVTASDILADNVMLPTGLTSPRFVELEVRTAVGVPKAHTAEITVSGQYIRFNFAGATDPIATDVITWSAWE